MNQSDIAQTLETEGMVVVPDVFTADFMDAVARDIDAATKVCLGIQLKQRVGQDSSLIEALEGGDGALGGAAHHVICFEGAFFELLLQQPLFPVIESHLGEGPFILNSFGAVTNTNQNNMYEHGKTIHRDSRSFHPTFRQQCWFMVLVDDFTLENGATWMWQGSHDISECPSKEEFYANAHQVVGKKGSVVVFDGRLWHAAGKNHTDVPRRCLTISFTKPFVKQQMDYVRFFGADRVSEMDPTLQQLFGYHARTPANYDEWYQPAATRFYKSNQG